MSFGASTRVYTLREKPQTQTNTIPGGEVKAGEDEELKGLLGLPEEETELENLTEFNTAHNKRISTLTIEDGNLDIVRPKRKRRSSRVSFSEEEVIINPGVLVRVDDPRAHTHTLAHRHARTHTRAKISKYNPVCLLVFTEDVDPSVGRFRNMVQTAVVPIKKRKMEGHATLGLEDSVARRMQNFPFSGGLYGDLPPTIGEAGSLPAMAQGGATILGGLPLVFPNPAPEVDLSPTSASAQPFVTPSPAVILAPGPYTTEALNEPRKKKYAKEAWPGKKPTPSLLI
ncbi:nuclear inhibitor of protein phosphatase 1 isoform X5 [Oncorhynchus mykiss]|nr:nuclear inhibitor of protein phosphatase 1 isoform X5 [Oncorhynchus mykiss]